MPSKKKKYNARFPAGRIKKIMQTDEEIGKVAQAVPVIISRTLELFVESLLKKAMQITSAKNAKTLTPTHMKQCILSESRFDFLKDLVKGIPDVSSTEDEFGTPSGNISPGTPISAKSYSGYSCFQFHQSSDSSASKNSGATSHSIPSTATTTTITSNIQTSASVSLISQPKFYKEIPIGSEECENENNENSSPSMIQGSSVIQHTGSQQSFHSPIIPPIIRDGNSSSFVRTISGHNTKQPNELKFTNSIKISGNAKPVSEQVTTNEEMEEEEDDDEDEEELHVAENGYHTETDIATKTCTIDEDYDT